MSKAHRGRPLKSETPLSGRGSCPICERTGIKVLYEQDINGNNIVSCKQCKSSIAHGKYKDKLAKLAPAVTEETPQE